MTINTTRDNSHLTLALEGRLDTSTVPQLEAVLQKELPARWSTSPPPGCACF